MIKKELWVKERGKDCYSPVDVDTNEVMIGFCIITNKSPGEVIGEYWFEKDDSPFLCPFLYRSLPNPTYNLCLKKY